MEVFSGSDVSHQDCPKNSFFKFGIPTALAQTEGVDQPEQGDQKERRTRRFYPKCNGDYPTSKKYYPKSNKYYPTGIVGIILKVTGIILQVLQVFSNR